MTELPAAPVRVLFIAGLGRSGSTLLDRVLGQVPGCCSIGEASQVWRSLSRGTRCGCGRLPRECPFWSAVVTAAFGGWNGLDVQGALDLQHRVDRTRYVPLLAAPRRPAGFQRDLDAYGALLAALYREVSQVAPAELVIDSGKHTSTAYLLRHLPGVQARVVHLVRDSRGVAYSWTKSVKKSHFEDAEDMDRLRPEVVARDWVVHNVLLHGLRAVGTPTRFLRYEDFVADPRPTLAAIARFAGLAAGAADVPFVSDTEVDLSAEDHTLAGNPMRFQRHTVTIAADSAWQQQLSEDDQRRVRTLTAPLLLAYRYPLGRGGASSRTRAA